MEEDRATVVSGNGMTELNQFEIGRMYERRETRDQLLVIAKIQNEEQRAEILLAWLTDLMDNLPDERVSILIEETYVVFE